MTNLVTMNEYQSIKNERYVVLVFKDGKRLITHGGVGLLEAMELQMHYQMPNRITLIVNEGYTNRRKEDKTCVKWDILDFADLFALGSGALYRP